MIAVRRIRAALRRLRRDRRSRSAERGATLVEYAMIVAVFVIPVWAGITFVNDTAKDQMGGVAERVATQGSTTTTHPDGGGGGAPGGPTTTTTQPASTTTSSTTTTTQPKKSNTAPTVTVSKGSGGKWNSTFSTVVTDASGKAVKDATVTFRVCFKTTSNGSWGSCKDYTAKTSSSGSASHTLSRIESKYVAVQVTVTSITKSGTTFNVDSTATMKNKP
jgi:Flp pilus assembly pilin Flp